MRRINAAAFQSLDGVMQAPGGPSEDITGGFRHGGWLAGLGGDAVADEAVGALFGSPFALLLGRRTYDIFAGHWPYVEDQDGFAASINAAEKFVLTRSDAPLDWENSRRLADLEAVAALKETDGPDLLIQGSGTIYAGLLARGLIDRLTLMTFPVLLGGGKRSFDGVSPALRLELIEHRVSPAGTIIATYLPRGAVTSATFAVPAPNARDDERQRRMRDGTW